MGRQEETGGRERGNGRGPQGKRKRATGEKGESHRGIRAQNLIWAAMFKSSKQYYSTYF